MDDDGSRAEAIKSSDPEISGSAFDDGGEISKVEYDRYPSYNEVKYDHNEVGMEIVETIQALQFDTHCQAYDNI